MESAGRFQTKSDHTLDVGQLRLNQISSEEQDTLRELIPLLHKLPRPLTDYTQAIGALREEMGIRGRSRYRQEAIERRR
jgi:hypothetical protein